MVFHGRLVQIEVMYLGRDVLEDGLDKPERIKQDIVKDSLRPQTQMQGKWLSCIFSSSGNEWRDAQGDPTLSIPGKELLGTTLCL